MIAKNTGSTTIVEKDTTGETGTVITVEVVLCSIDRGSKKSIKLMTLLNAGAAR